MYFPDNSLIPFLHNFDSTLKEVMNEECFVSMEKGLYQVFCFS